VYQTLANIFTPFDDEEYEGGIKKKITRNKGGLITRPNKLTKKKK